MVRPCERTERIPRDGRAAVARARDDTRPAASLVASGPERGEATASGVCAASASRDPRLRQKLGIGRRLVVRQQKGFLPILTAT